MSNVTVYSKPNCPQCTQTKKKLEQKGIAFEVIDISQDKKAAQTSIKISPITTNTTQNSIRHKIYTSKKNPSLYSQQDSLQQKKSSKVFILHPLSKGPEAHFPKHKYI